MYVNGRFASKPLSGVSRVPIELIKAADGLLGSRRADLGMELLLPPDAGPLRDLTSIRQRSVGRLTGNSWEQLSLVRASRGRPLVNLANTAPVGRGRQVVLVYDCAVYVVPQAFRRSFVAWYRFLFRRFARTADLVVTISESSKEELCRYAGMAEERIVVAPPGADHITRPHAVVPTRFEELGIRTPYVLAVGGNNVRKNYGLVAEALALTGDLGLTLVVVGSAPGVTITAPTSRAIELGHVADGELRWLYENALCLAFPSLYEGFGLPPVEAMACGCPVIVSNRGALTETCGDAALYCDPTSPQDLARLIRDVAGDGALADDLREKGFGRAAAFTWEDSARRLLDYLASTYETQ